MLVGYARVSTADQDPALQLDALAKAGCERVFEERALGARSDRPVLADAMASARDGDTLVVWRLDRFGRSLKDLIAKVAELEATGVGFRSLTESIDTTTAGGRLVLHVFGALAEFERELIRERTVAGLEAARARGRKGGRPPALNRRQVSQAAALLKDRETVVADVLATFRVSKSTLYRYVSPTGDVRRMPER